MSTKKKVSYKVGNHVILNQDREGFIRYIGTTSFGSGKWYGIELSNGNVGQHNGTFAGKKYFECDELRGIFVRKKEILRLFTSKGNIYFVAQYINIHTINIGCYIFICT